MFARWSFFALDWSRFMRLQPLLIEAYNDGDFRKLDIPEVGPLLLEMGLDAPHAEICNALIVDVCSDGEAITVDGGMAELIRAIRRKPNGDEPADLLAELVSAAPAVQPWFQVEEGLVGILEPERVRELVNGFRRFRKTLISPAPSRGLASITRRFAACDPAADHLADLMQLVDEAAARNMALAASRER